MFLYSILSLFILLSPPSSSPSSLTPWFSFLSMGIRSAMAQGVTANVSTSALSFQPPQAWTSIDDGVVTTTSGASINYICAKPCTAIEILGSLPDGQGADFTLCLDCVGAQDGLTSNSTSLTITDAAATFFASNLPPAKHSLQITLNSNTDFIVTGIQVTTVNTPEISTSSSTTSSTTSTSSSKSTSSTSTSTSTSSSSTSTSTFTPSDSSALSSSSSSHTTAIAIGAAAGVLVLALIAGSIFFCIRRRRRRQDRFQAGGKGGWNQRFTKIISWPRASMEGKGPGQGGQEQDQPSSPMLETFRTSRNLDAEYGLGTYGGGGYAGDGSGAGRLDAGSGFGNVPIGAAGAPAFVSTPNLNEGLRPSEDINRDVNSLTATAQRDRRGPPRTGTVRTQRSVYSTYSDPWDYVDEYYNSEGEQPDRDNNDDGGNDSDSSGQGHTYPNPYSPNSPASSKAERLKANLRISTSRSLSKKRATTATQQQRRDTTASAFQTPAVVKNMLSDLNDALKTNADRFAWKKNSVQGGLSDGGGGGGGNGAGRGGGNVPMQFLSPNAAVTSRETRGHRPTRSTDVLI